jgi:hypothetical protein
MSDEVKTWVFEYIIVPVIILIIIGLPIYLVWFR